MSWNQSGGYRVVGYHVRQRHGEGGPFSWKLSHIYGKVYEKRDLACIIKKV